MTASLNYKREFEETSDFIKKHLNLTEAGFVFLIDVNSLSQLLNFFSKQVEQETTGSGNFCKTLYLLTQKHHKFSTFQTESGVQLIDHVTVNIYL